VTPQQYIAAIPEPKRSELATLHRLIRKTIPSFEPAVTGTMIGYGRFHYRYASGREGDAFRVALAANKTGISVYVLAMDGDAYVAEQHKARLGKASVGKSCIRFKRLADIDLGVLTEALQKARQLPAAGEVSAARPPAKKKARPAKTKVPAARPTKKKAPAKESGRLYALSDTRR